MAHFNRQDYQDGIQFLPGLNIPDGMPLFLLNAGDQYAVLALKTYYTELQETNKVTPGTVDEKFIASVGEQITNFETWQAANGMKVPGLPTTVIDFTPPAAAQPTPAASVDTPQATPVTIPAPAVSVVVVAPVPLDNGTIKVTSSFTHVITQQDIYNNPGGGLKINDTVQVPFGADIHIGTTVQFYSLPTDNNFPAKDGHGPVIAAIVTGITTYGTLNIQAFFNTTGGSVLIPGIQHKSAYTADQLPQTQYWDAIPG
jgi:hypothetical protein